MPELPSPLDAFLRDHHRAFLFCRDDAGNPIGYPMRTLTFDSGLLYFATYTKSAKVRHLRANPEAACVVTDEKGSSWVSVRGRAEVYRPSPEDVARLLGRSSPESRVPEGVIATVHERLLSGKRSFIRVDVDEVPAHG